MGNKALTGTENRLIITYTGSDSGFVEFGFWMFESRKHVTTTLKWMKITSRT